MSSNDISARVYIPKAWYSKNERFPEHAYHCRTCPSEYQAYIFIQGQSIPYHQHGIRRVVPALRSHPDLDTQVKFDKVLRGGGFLLLQDLPNVKVEWKKLKTLDAREVQHVLTYCGITEVWTSGSNNAQNIEALVLHPNELRRLESLKGTIPDWHQSKAWPDQT